MFKRLGDLNDMAYFAAVAQYRGFSSAGRALGLSKSLLSRRVAELESHLGIRLLNRTSRHFSLTEAGEQYAESCKKVLRQAEEAQQAVNSVLAHPKGRLRVAAPVMMTEQLLSPLINRFLDCCPDVQIELLALNREVDILEEGIDIAIRAESLPLKDSGLYARRLGQQYNILAVSPKFVENHGVPTSFRHLKELPVVAQSGDTVWVLEKKGEGARKLPIVPRLVSNNLQVLIQAAVDGLGIALLPELVCREIIGQGRLHQVLHEWRSPLSGIYAIYASNKGQSSAFRLFMDHLSGHLADMLSRAATSEILPYRPVPSEMP